MAAATLSKAASYEDIYFPIGGLVGVKKLEKQAILHFSSSDHLSYFIQKTGEAFFKKSKEAGNDISDFMTISLYRVYPCNRHPHQKVGFKSKILLAPAAKYPFSDNIFDWLMSWWQGNAPSKTGFGYRRFESGTPTVTPPSSPSEDPNTSPKSTGSDPQKSESSPMDFNESKSASSSASSTPAQTKVKVLPFTSPHNMPPAPTAQASLGKTFFGANCTPDHRGLCGKRKFQKLSDTSS